MLNASTLRTMPRIHIPCVCGEERCACSSSSARRDASGSTQFPSRVTEAQHSAFCVSATHLGSNSSRTQHRALLNFQWRRSQTRNESLVSFENSLQVAIHQLIVNGARCRPNRFGAVIDESPAEDKAVFTPRTSLGTHHSSGISTC